MVFRKIVCCVRFWGYRGHEPADASAQRAGRPVGTVQLKSVSTKGRDV
jgi:hypothetical protein